MALLLGIDLGTSYFKVGLFDEAGSLKGLGRVAVPKSEPAPGRCELAVGDFWLTLRRGLADAMKEAGAAPRDIVAMSYSSQATTFLLLDATDAPLTPLIVWLDTRGDPVSANDAGFADSMAFRQAIGYAGISGQTATAKWRWFQRNEPEMWRRAAHVMTVSDYFTFALTGERVGDASTAAFVGLYELESGNWWPDALRHFEIEAERLSRSLRPGSPVGRTTANAGELLGLPAGIAFAVGGIDHHVAAIGAGVDVLGELSISTGTVLAALALVERATPQEGCFYGPHSDGKRFYRLAFDPDGAGQLEEYQRRAAPDHSIENLLAAAGSAAGDAPHGAAVRAILQRIATAHQRLAEKVVGPGGVHRIVATGGGARSPLLLQYDADTMGCQVRATVCAEPACFGAAIFAAVAAKQFPSVDEAVRAMVRSAKVFDSRARSSSFVVW